MKWFLIIVAIALSVSLASAKSVDKKRNHHHKKASSAKPTKTPKSIVEQFRGLPADDLAFIEQLDKQFQLHGEKVKIKVERDNTTQTTANGKNSKRTIDGSLSYGYHQNGNHGQQQQFYFTKPRYEIFPYSQEEHSPVQHSYSKHGADTTVEITQSQGYEIKEIPDDYPQTYSQNFVRFPGQDSSPHGRGHYQQHQHDQHQQQQLQPVAHEEVPVIVLKVPGPTKYAVHLRTLLQQYLEIRAAEVIRELQEQEAAAEQQLAYHQQQQQQHHVQAQQHYRQHHIHPQALQTHVQYATPASVLAEQEQAYRHQQQQLHYHQQHINAQVSQGTIQIESSEENHQQNVGHAVYGNPTTPTPEHSHIDYLQGEYGAANAQAGQTVYEDHQTHYVTAQPELNHQEYYQHEQAAYHHHNQQHHHQQADYHQQPQREEYRHHGHIQYAEQPEQQQYGYSTPSQEEVDDHHHEQQQQQHLQQHHEEAQNGAVESHVENPENYPDEKHTRVVFTKSLHNQPLLKPEQLQHQQEQQYHQEEQQMVIIAPPEAHHQHHLQQQLQHHHIQGEEQPQYHHVPEPQPQHHPERIYLPTPLPDASHQEYSQVDVHQNEQDEAAAAAAHAEEQHRHHNHDYNQQDIIATPGPFITITQKRKMNRIPFNYHAHGRVSTPAPRKRETPYTEDQFNKFNKLVHRLKKKQVTLMNERSKKSTPDQQPSSDQKKQEQK